MTLTMALVAIVLQVPRDTRSPMASAAATASISGVVISDEAEPRPLRRARVSINGQSLDMGRTVITGDDGSFTFTGLVAGSYTVLAARETYVTMSYGATRAGRPGLPIPVRAGEDARVTLRLPRGAVITGAVLDVDGAPAQGITVSALERRFSGTGEYRYAPAGTSAVPTDDRGIYRIYGLPAGDYVVAAQPGQATAPGATALTYAIRPMVQGAPGARPLTMTQVFHPSAVDPTEAARITLHGGEERSGVDVQLQYVPIARISGTVAIDSRWGAPTVSVIPAANGSDPDWVRATSAGAGGAFTVDALPPGRYQVSARAIDAGGHLVAASASVTLAGEDVDDVALTPAPAPAVSGLVVFRGDTTPPVFGTERSDRTTARRVLDSSPAMQVDGVRFTIQGVGPGRYFVGANVMGVRRSRAGWWLQSVSANGVELLDAPLDLRQDIDNAVAVFTDRASVLSGTVVDAGGNPLPDAAVVAFSADRSTWFFQSRRIVGTSPDASGRYAIRNLPPGEYRVVAVTGLEPNEWFDPAVLERLLPVSTPLTLPDAGAKTMDLVVR